MANTNDKIKVSIVCGHGKQTNGVWDSGATYGSEQEAKRMLPITKHFVELAEINGFEVITDVPKNNINMIEQVKLANKEKVDVHIAIHCDWYKASSGSFGLYCKGSSKGKKLATCLNTYVKKLTGIRSKGVIARTDLYELNQTNMPACVFECGSIKADRYEWDTDQEAYEYGKALCMGLCKYYGKTFIEKKETASTTEKTTTKKKYSGTFPKLPTRGYFASGDTGTQVKYLQTFLNWAVGAGLKVDGEIGTKTIAAVKSFQKKYGLTADGLFGAKSLAKAKTIQK